MGESQDATNTGVALTMGVSLIFKFTMGTAMSSIWKTLDTI